MTTDMDDAGWEPLRLAATAALAHAYAPYSKFPVGAAARLEDGSIVTGCNVENASYGLTLCAECTMVGAAADERRRAHHGVLLRGRQGCASSCRAGAAGSCCSNSARRKRAS